MLSLSGCHARDESIDRSQLSELASDIQAFHFCVAHAAVALDDRRTAIVGVAERALDACSSQVKEISTLLNATSMSDGEKSQYVDELIKVAADRSAAMLRRLRAREDGTREI